MSGDLDKVSEITTSKFERNRARERDLDWNNKHCVQNERDIWHKFKMKEIDDEE